MAASTARIMMVRRKGEIGVDPLHPSLPKMAVRAAKTVDSAAQADQGSNIDFIRVFLALRPRGMRTLAKFMLAATEST
jgi:hypothetical protein